MARSTPPSSVFAQVHALIAAIPRGRVATYGQLSFLIDRRLTPVGIGWALHTAGDRIPWHRVVNAKGGISTDGEAPGRQRALLEAEGVRFRRDGTVDLSIYQWKPRSRRGSGVRGRRRRPGGVLDSTGS